MFSIEALKRCLERWCCEKRRKLSSCVVCEQSIEEQHKVEEHRSLRDVIEGVKTLWFECG